MRFVIDGYNVAKGDPATAGLTLERMRDELVARLAVRGAELLGRGPIVVVFDGRAGVGADERRGPVEVRYSRDEPADDVIVRLAEAWRGEVTVVTSDRGLAARVAGRGVTVRPAEVCFAGAPGSRPRRTRAVEDVGLPPGANKVTEELKRIWLGDEE
jgi:predicted RNA-binding protein with PIN domain